MAKKSTSAKRSRSSANGEAGEGKVNKSQAIRDYLSINKKAMPKEVVAALQEKSISVSPNMVSMVKAKSKVRRAQRKAKRDTAAGTITAAQSGSAAGLDAALTLYKAARGQDASPGKVRQAFLLLVETLG